MSKWDDMPCTGFDLETGGVDPLNDRIVQAAIVQVRPGHRPVIHRWLINPGVEIAQSAIDVHGITNEQLRAEGMDPAQALFEITGILALSLGHGVPVVAMNGSFDLTMLEAENLRHGVEGLLVRLGHGKIQPVIDPGVLDRYADRYRRGGRKLVDLCTTYGVRHTGAHDSAGDALAACRLWPRIIAKHPQAFRGQTLPGLHQAQVGWRGEQCDGLRAYFDKNQIEHDGVDAGWPLLKGLARVIATAGASA